MHLEPEKLDIEDIVKNMPQDLNLEPKKWKKTSSAPPKKENEFDDEEDKP